MIPGVIHWRTIPVPYVASWSSERGWRIAQDPRANGRHCLFPAEGRRGLGTPRFGEFDPARVREVVLEQRCQVCRGSLRDGAYVADLVVGQHGSSPIVNEPPACKRCFEVAITQCPGLRRMRTKPRFLAAVARRITPILTLLKPVEGGDAALNAALEQHRRGPAYGYARIALVDWQPIALTPRVEVAT